MKTTLRILVLAAGLALAFPSHAFRCGTDLVQEGDRKYDVLEKCGEPDFRESYAGAYLQGIGAVDVIEKWYYDPGSTRMIRILTFQQGRLRSIETGARGFSGTVPRDNACQPYELGIGMSKYELIRRCGYPVARDEWLAPDGSYYHHRYRLQGVVRVEEWTYVFGSNRFRRYVRLIEGRIVDIQTGDKGG